MNPAAKRHLAAVFLLAVIAVAAAPAAADMGIGEAAYARGDYPAALREFRRLAARGVAKAQLNLGIMYEQGRGVPQDYVAAVTWYEKAAAQGMPDAQNNLGLMYAQGRGVPQDYVKALKWFKRAAAQGVANAQNNLGLAYLNGFGVGKNHVHAHVWFNLAASKGSEPARKNRDDVAAKMTRAQIAKAQKIARDWVLVFERPKK